MSLRTAPAWASLLCATWLQWGPAAIHASERTVRDFDIGPQSLSMALGVFARQSRQQVLFTPEVVLNKRTDGVQGMLEPLQALERLLQDTGIAFSVTPGGTILIGAPTVSTQSHAVEHADRQQIEEVIVTARKRDERLLDVPVAVSAFTSEAIESRGANSIGDFLQDAPGVSMYDRGGTYKVSIRGVSTSLGANENGYYLDDLPFTGVTVPINPDVRSWDVARVEVLRGPQGTLFGEGSMGGTIRTITQDAQFNAWQAKASLSGSSTAGGGDNTGIKGTVNVPVLDDRLALRLTATRERYDGWIDDPANHRDDVNSQAITTYRARVRFQPTQRWSLNASYWHFKGDYPRDNSATDQGRAGSDAVLATGVEYDLAGASMTYDLGSASLFYSFARNDASLPQDGRLFGNELRSNIELTVKSHELRLSSSGAAPWQWTIGGYQRDARRRDWLVYTSPDIDNTDTTDVRSQALFSEVTYSLSSLPVDLTAGLRYVRERIGGLELNHGVESPGQDATYASTNPRAIVAWRPSEHWRVYLSAAKGYRSGQLQPLVSMELAGPLNIRLPAALSDDRIWSYELGAKAQLMQGRVAFAGAVYRSDWRDVAVRIPLGADGFNGLINSKGTTTNGIEVSVVFRLAQAWIFNVNASYADAQYAGAVPGTGIAKGRPVDDVAKTTAAASVSYARPLFDEFMGSVRLGLQYNSARDFPSFGPPQYLPGDAITSVAARVGVTSAHWGVFLFADNLTNQDGAVSPRLATFAAGVNDITATRLRPRTVGLELRANF